MKLQPIQPDLSEFPTELHGLLAGAQLYDSSCSPQARVIYIQKDDGYFLKSAPAGSLEQEAAMTQYFHGKGLSAQVLHYLPLEKDWMLTARVPGADCIEKAHLAQPERLCDILAERLYLLHQEDVSGCPVMNRTAQYLQTAKHNYQTGQYDASHFPDSFGYCSAEEAMDAVQTKGHLLECNVLLHGDYCLPNILLDNWAFSGFIDVGNGGAGDRHIDIFWGIWSLQYNLKTDRCRQRFIDAYGRSLVDEERLRVVAAAEVFG